MDGLIWILRIVFDATGNAVSEIWDEKENVGMKKFEVYGEILD